MMEAPRREEGEKKAESCLKLKSTYFKRDEAKKVKEKRRHRKEREGGSSFSKNKRKKEKKKGQ